MQCTLMYFVCKYFYNVFYPALLSKMDRIDPSCLRRLWPHLYVDLDFPDKGWIHFAKALSAHNGFLYTRTPNFSGKGFLQPFLRSHVSTLSTPKQTSVGYGIRFHQKQSLCFPNMKVKSNLV